MQIQNISIFADAQRFVAYEISVKRNLCKHFTHVEIADSADLDVFAIDLLYE